MAIIDSVKLPDNSAYDLADNYSGYQTETLATPIDINGDTETMVEGALSGLNDYGDALADNLAANENVYGAKNLLPYPWYETTKSANGLTFTDNGDGTLTLGTGTASADTYFEFCRRYDYKVFLQNGTYLCTGCPQGVPVGVSISNINTDSMNTYSDTGNGVEMPINGTALGNTGSYVGMGVEVKNGTVISTPITFKPMIRDARVIDDTFVPYAPTNRELMSYKANGKVGAKNMLYYPYHDTTKTENGVTFTDNGDGSVTVVTVGGGATDNTYFFIKYAEPLNIEGMLKLSGCPLGGSGDTYYATLYYTYNGVYYGVLDTGNGGMFKIENSHLGTPCYMVIAVRTGTIINNAITFKPMIRIAEDTDETYQPYAMTNKQLTDTVKEEDISSQLTVNTTYFNTSVLIEYKKMCNGLKWLFIYGQPITTAPHDTALMSGFTPQGIHKVCPVYNMVSQTTRFVRIWTDSYGQLMIDDDLSTTDMIIYNDVIR